MSITLILVIILILILLGGIPYVRSQNWGMGGPSLVGIVIIILILYLLFGRGL